MHVLQGVCCPVEETHGRFEWTPVQCSSFIDVEEIKNRTGPCSVAPLHVPFMCHPLRLVLRSELLSGREPANLRNMPHVCRRKVSCSTVRVLQAGCDESIVTITAGHHLV